MSEEVEQGRFGSAGAAIGFGALRFTVVSLLAFGIWAVGPRMPEWLLYSLIALAFIGLSGVLMSGLLQGPRPMARWYLIFIPGFLLFSVCWCAGWFGIGGHLGEIFGSAAGIFFLVRTIIRGTGGRGVLLECAGVVFLFYTLGYYFGEVLFAGGQGHEWLAPVMDALPAKAGKAIACSLWGLTFGAGLGAGLGYAFWKSQRSAA